MDDLLLRLPRGWLAVLVIGLASALGAVGCGSNSTTTSSSAQPQTVPSSGSSSGTATHTTATSTSSPTTSSATSGGGAHMGCAGIDDPAARSKCYQQMGQ
jgi:hypothetical protein